MTASAGLEGRAAGSALMPDAASRLAAGATVIFAALPVAMALANRSAPLIVAIAAVLVAAAAAADAGWHGLVDALRSAFLSRLGLVSAACVAFAFASYGWSVDRAQSLHALGEAALPLGCGAILLVLLPRLAPNWTATALAIGIIAAALICIVELKFDMPFRNALHLRAKEFEYNRPVLTLLALFWPLLAAAVASWRQPLLWIALAAATAAIWSSQSGTAMFAQMVSGVAVLLAWRLPRTSLLIAAIGVAIIFVSIFAFGDIAWRILPDATYRVLAWTHAADRVEIWRSFGAAMLLHPWIGTGFDSSVTLGDSPIVTQVAEEFRRMLPVGHPHNGYLQIGVELGLVGCLLALAVVLGLLWSWRHLPGRPLVARLGLFAMAASTMLVGHGAWQAWWIAVLFAGGAAARIFAGDGPVLNAGGKLP